MFIDQIEDFSYNLKNILSIINNISNVFIKEEY